MNSHFHYQSGQLFCEDVAAESLARDFGTPLYVYSRAVIEERYRDFARAFAPLHPLIAYSVKANGNLSVLRILAGMGAGADIVSAGELQRALLAGIPAERIIVDPGLGFAKEPAHTYEALARLAEFSELGRPLLVGPSRKRFLTRPFDVAQGKPFESSGRPAGAGRGTTSSEMLASARDWATAAAVAAAMTAMTSRSP